MDKKTQPFIEFHLTEICNYRCEYCVDGKGIEGYNYEYGHAKDDIIEGFFKFLERIGPGYWIQFTGGEPFLHPRIMEIVKKTIELGNKVSFITNLSLPLETYKQLFEVAKDNLVKLHATFHLSQIHNLDETIDKAIAINEIKPQNTIFEIKSLLKEDNFEILQYMDKRFRKYNVPFIYGRIVDENAQYIQYSNEKEIFLNDLNQQYTNWLMTTRDLNVKKVSCYAGYKMFNITWYGDVLRCHSPQYIAKYDKLGNLKNPDDINILNCPKPCFAEYCRCEHPTEKNLYYYDKNISAKRNLYNIMYFHNILFYYSLQFIQKKYPRLFLKIRKAYKNIKGEK